jgi:hypothetical protein
MIDLSKLADRIAAAKTHPARAEEEQRVLSEIEEDARRTWDEANAATSFKDAVRVKDYADQMARFVPNLYLTVPVPQEERSPISGDWETRIMKAADDYRAAAILASTRADRLAALMPKGEDVPTPSGKGGTPGKKKDDNTALAVGLGVLIAIGIAFPTFQILAIIALAILAFFIVFGKLPEAVVKLLSDNWPIIAAVLVAVLILTD